MVMSAGEQRSGVFQPGVSRRRGDSWKRLLRHQRLRGTLTCQTVECGYVVRSRNCIIAVGCKISRLHGFIVLLHARSVSCNVSVGEVFSCRSVADILGGTLRAGRSVPTLIMAFLHPILCDCTLCTRALLASLCVPGHNHQRFYWGRLPTGCCTHHGR